MTVRAGASSPPTQESARLAEGGGQSKYTVMMTPKTVAALKEAAQINYETRTNVINRGVQLYLLITRLINSGWTIYARDEEGREQMIPLL